MPEPPARVTTPSKAAAIVLLVLQVVGTGAMLVYGTWELWNERRGDGLLYLSLSVLWFMLLSWRLRWLLNPKPA
ncbi:MAG: hypothetical protein HYT80_03830 [Euryarchaeota archaeon]|nr:hypothetical protein [Euryarchaeota archaeon]